MFITGEDGEVTKSSKSSGSGSAVVFGGGVGSFLGAEREGRRDAADAEPFVNTRGFEGCFVRGRGVIGGVCADGVDLGIMAGTLMLREACASGSRGFWTGFSMTLLKSASSPAIWWPVVSLSF